ncbi:dynein light chain Tctex-type protein 2-like [Toxorhynchites rutilus septentrionalis]|uniref:dynein light chain Tctex-type protein 2-like n=1 Tax=Toxorhynchites rutilus septentrionalis TaxID=329112 RepID=UPI00247AF4D7|nr:dynein light chain Tctex-type protein 2-like [Toxorhynchites rutilus septentrionalis]
MLPASMAVWGSLKISSGKQAASKEEPKPMRFSESLIAALGNRKCNYKEVSKDMNAYINKEEEKTTIAIPPYSVNRLKTMMQKVIRQQFIIRNEDGDLLKWVYNPDKNLELCQKIAKTIKDKIRAYNYERYRIISLCSIVEKDGQGVQYKMKYILDPYLDNYVQYVHDMAKFWIISTVILAYKD